MRAFLLFLLSCLVLCFLVQSPLYAQSDPSVAELYSAEGRVEASTLPAQSWKDVAPGAQFGISEALRTAKKSRAGVLFVDGTLVRLNESTFMEFKGTGVAAAGERPLTIASGTAYFFSREPKNFPRIDTPVVSAAVRGTEFVVKVTPDQTIVSVLDGVVACSNQFGSVEVRRGEEAITMRGQAPVKRIMLQPQDAVQWALYYPAVLSIADYPDFVSNASAVEQSGIEALRQKNYSLALSQFAGNSWRATMGRSMVAYQQGEIGRAFQELESFNDAMPSGMHLYLAALNLSVGQVEAAGQALDAAQASLDQAPAPLKPKLLASFYALNSVISLVQNRKAEALSFSDKSLEMSSDSAAAALTRSYVNQANFNLEGAKENLEQVIKLEPANALARARLAEIELGFGETEKAQRLAEEARAEAPEEVYPSIVMGFAYLSKYQTTEAIAEFEHALNLDRTSGLAHLGYGLALIREGQLEQGRLQIEKAVHLEPNVSVYRSYLGKAYFEGDRNSIAANEFERAKQLDPLDPTPYLYGAYHKLATYKPVDALDDLETSIRLNNNRAVYRSSFLLDQDNAVRGASLANTFNTLGFTKVARIEAIKSVSRDYTNFSAHSFLAESTGDNLELAQSSISQNIISSLLSPVNFNFILPNPSSQASLNEYTSLFDRPQVRTLLQGAARTGDQSYLGEIVNAGSTGRFAYAVRYNGEYSDGFRQSNDDSRFQLFSNTLAYQITPDDSIFSKFSYVAANRGSTSYQFDPYENDPDSSTDTDTMSAEVGYSHRFGPRSNFLAYFSFTNNRINLEDQMVARNPLLAFETAPDLPPRPFDMDTDLMLRNRFKGYRTNLQHIWNSDLLTTVVGVEILEAKVEQSEESPIISDEFNLFAGNGFLTTGRHDEDAQSTFAYSTLHATDWLDVTAGVDYTQVDLGRGNFFPPFTDEQVSNDKWSPKIGALVYVAPETTLRAAYFESIGVSGVADLESIQPTVVGGFTQVFDQIPGSSYASYAFGIDHKWPGSTYIGAEYLHSDVKTYLPQTFDLITLNADTGDIQRTTELDEVNIFSDENGWNGYLYQVLSRTLTATLDYSIFRENDRFFDSEIVSNKVRAGLNYFHPTGWFGFASATWRHQDREGLLGTQTISVEEQNGSSNFWILGLGAGYQLPNRHGSIVFALQNLLDENYTWQPTGRDFNPIPRFGAGLAYSLNF